MRRKNAVEILVLHYVKELNNDILFLCPKITNNEIDDKCMIKSKVPPSYNKSIFVI